MRLEFIAVGSELLDGRILNSNQKTIGNLLRQYGLKLRYTQSVGDSEGDLAEVFETAAKRSDWVLVSGGLGPTQDDLSLKAFCEWSSLPYLYSEKIENMIRNRLESIGSQFRDLHKNQAYCPENSTLLANENGTAPGIDLRYKETRFTFLPGIPVEMKGILENLFEKEFQEQSTKKRKTWSTVFSSESFLEEKLSTLYSEFQGKAEISYQTSFPYNFISLNYDEKNETNLENIFQKVTALLEKKTISISSENTSLEKVLLRQSIENSEALFTVESCTGGLIAHLLTNCSGSSAAYEGSLLSYSNQMKKELGVEASLLEKCGAVSEEVLKSLLRSAQGAAEKLALNKKKYQGIKILATTGIAGPSGGSEEKPVGSAYVGVLSKSFTEKEATLKIEKVPHMKNRDRLFYKNYFANRALYLALGG